MKSGLALLLSLPIRSYQSIPPLKFWTISYLRAALPESPSHGKFENVPIPNELRHSFLWNFITIQMVWTIY